VTWRPIELHTDPEAHDWHDADPADVLAHLAGLLERPAWHRSARCAVKSVGLDVFFPRQGQSLEPARGICAGCPVKSECLAAALEVATVYDSGVWGGTSAKQRKQLRREVGEDAA
jgi:WhiB family redox-sensing transcriptional regulator